MLRMLDCGHRMGHKAGEGAVMTAFKPGSGICTNSAYLDYCEKMNLMPTEEGQKEWLRKQMQRQKAKEEMKCGICKETVHPLDAHMGRINGQLDVFHIDCWNRHLTEQGQRLKGEGK